MVATPGPLAGIEGATANDRRAYFAAIDAEDFDLAAAIRREAEELRAAADECADTDPARTVLLREDRDRVLARLDHNERAAA